jgi:cell division protein FtsQ
VAQRTLRHLLAAAGVVAVGIGGYAGLRASSVFSVDSVTVEGAADASVRAQVEAETRAAVGHHGLLAVDAAAIEARLRLLPSVQSVSVDRAFPHRLDVTLVPEEPVARLPYGTREAVVAKSGRILDVSAPGAHDALPAVAAAPVDVPAVGARVRAPLVLDGIAVAAAARGLQGLQLTSLRWTPDGLVARAGAGWELRLGDAGSAEPKLLTARALLRSLSRETRDGLRYVDVSAPAVPVVRATVPDPRTAAPSVLVTAEATAAADAAATAASADATSATWQLPGGDASDVLVDLFGHSKS